MLTFAGGARAHYAERGASSICITVTCMSHSIYLRQSTLCSHCGTLLSRSRCFVLTHAQKICSTLLSTSGGLFAGGGCVTLYLA